MKWINANEVLPSKGVEVLIYFDNTFKLATLNGKVDGFSFLSQGKNYVLFKADMGISKSVVYWTYLVPPQE